MSDVPPPTPPRALAPGDELLARWLNDLRALAISGASVPGAGAASLASGVNAATTETSLLPEILLGVVSGVSGAAPGEIASSSLLFYDVAIIGRPDLADLVSVPNAWRATSGALSTSTAAALGSLVIVTRRPNGSGGITTEAGVVGEKLVEVSCDAAQASPVTSFPSLTAGEGTIDFALVDADASFVFDADENLAFEALPHTPTEADLAAEDSPIIDADLAHQENASDSWGVESYAAIVGGTLQATISELYMRTTEDADGEILVDASSNIILTEPGLAESDELGAPIPES
jgi:hypothetical protein